MIYFDHNATTPPSRKVREFIQTGLVDYWANPSSEHGFGSKLADKIKEDRLLIADSLGVSTKGIIFTSGGTESINSILSVHNLESLKIKKIISSPLEHHATLDRLNFLKKNGFEIVLLPNNEHGRVDLNVLEDQLNSSTLVTILLANNEIGTINPIKKITQMVHQKGGLIHVDSVQAWGKVPLNLEDLDVDFASLSGHKIGALKGVGILYVKDVKSYLPLMHGGGQERGYRPGTINAASVHSLGLAVQDINLEKMHEVEKLRNYFESEIQKLSSIKINGFDSSRLPNTSNFFAGGRLSSELMFELSRKEIYVSTGSACNSGSFKPSHVLKALGLGDKESKGSLRISFSKDNTFDEVNVFINFLQNLIKE